MTDWTKTVWNYSPRYVKETQVSFKSKKSVRTRVKEFLFSRAVSEPFKRYHPILAYLTSYYPVTVGILILVILLLSSSLISVIYTIINGFVYFGA